MDVSQNVAVGMELMGRKDMGKMLWNMLKC